MHPREWVSLRALYSSSWTTSTSRLDPPERTSEASQIERFFNAVNQDEESALRDIHSLGCIFVTSSHRVWLCFLFLHTYLAVVGPYRSVLRIGLYRLSPADLHRTQGCQRLVWFAKHERNST